MKPLHLALLALTLTACAPVQLKTYMTPRESGRIDGYTKAAGAEPDPEDREYLEGFKEGCYKRAADFFKFYHRPWPGDCEKVKP